MKKSFSVFVLLTTLVITNGFSQKKGESIELFDKELSNFDLWNGVPHTTVKGLPEGTYQSDKVTQGTPLGLNNDLKNVFTTFEEDGETIIKITGEVYGCLTTKAVYENYHLSVMFKWGEKKWAPRLEDRRDSGILYHCYGEHGRFCVYSDESEPPIPVQSGPLVEVFFLDDLNVIQRY